MFIGNDKFFTFQYALKLQHIVNPLVRIRGAWFIGYLLDVKIKYMQQMAKTQIDTHPPILEILERIRDIEKNLKQLERRLK
jgi:hypothetical protein